MKKNTKKGMTLVEMLVTIVIITLVMAAFTLLGLKAWKTNGYILEQATATAASSRVLNKVVHEIRTARQGEGGLYPIKEVGEYSLIIYRDDNGDNKAERVHYFVENRQFKKGVTEFINGSYATDDANVEVLLNWVTNEDLNKPLFFFYNNEYPVDTVNNPMSAPNPYDIRLIKVHLWINIRPIVAPEYVNLESFAELRNLNEN